MNETATQQGERLRALYERDHRLRMLAQSAVSQVMQHHRDLDNRPIETRDVHNIALKAVVIALTRTYDEDAEIKTLRMERDHYRKIAEEALHLRQPQPLILPEAAIRALAGKDATGRGGEG